MADEYAEAVARVGRVLAREASSPWLNPDCRSILLDHGRPTARALVYLHGITSSPRQFAELGEQFFARGYNVLIPRLPYHGYADRMTADHALLRAADFTAYASQAVDIGRGLGAHLTLVGLSVGGVLAGWCAQTRADLDLAVLIAPSFAPFGLPWSVVPVLSRLALRLPNVFVWWHPFMRARLGPACSYPRFATHALAASFLVGAALGAGRPRAGRILVVTNRRDPAVNNAATARLAQRWRQQGAAVGRYAFERELGALHDIIGSYEHGARPEVVYPVLLRLIDDAGRPV